METEEIKQKLMELHEEYAFSRVELAKIMIIASTTLIAVSIPAALSFQAAEQKASTANSQLSQVSAVLNSERVQRSIDVLKDVEGSSFDQLTAAIEAFENTEKAVNSTEQLEKDLRRKKELYQWVVLIGIIGEVTGVAIFFS